MPAGAGAELDGAADCGAGAEAAGDVVAEVGGWVWGVDAECEDVVGVDAAAGQGAGAEGAGDVFVGVEGCALGVEVPCVCVV